MKEATQWNGEAFQQKDGPARHLSRATDLPENGTTAAAGPTSRHELQASLQSGHRPSSQLFVSFKDILPAQQAISLAVLCLLLRLLLSTLLLHGSLPLCLHQTTQAFSQAGQLSCA